MTMNETGTEVVSVGDQRLAAAPEQGRYCMIAEAAYYRAELRGFDGGDPVADWLEAEAEIEAMVQSAGEPSEEKTVKEAFEEKLEMQLDEWDKKLDSLMKMAKEAKADLRHDTEAQLKVLRAKRAAAQDKLQALRQRGDSAWEDMKEGAEKTWDEMRKAIDNIVDHLK
jgi:ElaB/YqjD/DUF883 family membrane-anchored ribosome-binding protein